MALRDEIAKVIQRNHNAVSHTEVDEIVALFREAMLSDDAIDAHIAAEIQASNDRVGFDDVYPDDFNDRHITDMRREHLAGVTAALDAVTTEDKE
jgi:hypothetical protein